MANEQRAPGWYFVLTRMNHRTPYKKWVALEWFHEPQNEEMGLEPYVWLDANQEEFYGDIAEVNETPLVVPPSPYKEKK